MKLVYLLIITLIFISNLNGDSFLKKLTSLYNNSFYNFNFKFDIDFNDVITFDSVFRESESKKIWFNLSCFFNSYHFFNLIDVYLITVSSDDCDTCSSHFLALFSNLSSSYSSAFCYFQLDSLNLKLNSWINNCLNGDSSIFFIDQHDNRHPCKSDSTIEYIIAPDLIIGNVTFITKKEIITSVIISNYSLNEDLIVFGTRDGFIGKIYSTVLLSLNKFSDHPITGGALQIQKAVIVFLSNTKLIKYYYNSCLIYKNCFECSYGIDPIDCFWCQNKCRKHCPIKENICQWEYNGTIPTKAPIQGGTIITIRIKMKDFLNTFFYYLMVKIDNVTCEIEKLNDTMIQCKTLPVKFPSSGSISIVMKDQYQGKKNLNNIETLFFYYHLKKDKSSLPVWFLQFLKKKYFLRNLKLKEDKFEYVVPYLLFIKPSFAPMTGNTWIILKGSYLNVGNFQKIVLNGINCTPMILIDDETLSCKVGLCSEAKCLIKTRVELYIDEALIQNSKVFFRYIYDFQINQLSKSCSFDKFSLFENFKHVFEFDYFSKSTEILYKYEVKLIALPFFNSYVARLERTAPNHPRAIFSLNFKWRNLSLDFVSDIYKFEMDYNFESNESIRTAIMASFAPQHHNWSNLVYYPIETLHTQLNDIIKNSSYIVLNEDGNYLNPGSNFSMKVLHIYVLQSLPGKLFAHLNSRVSSLYIFQDSHHSLTSIVIAGTETGFIYKIIYDGILNQAQYSNESIERSPKILNLTDNNSRLEFKSGLKKIIYPHQACSIYSNCFQCNFAQDPLECKWCQNMCRNKCLGQKSCGIKIYSITPRFGPIQGGTIITINGSNFSQILSKSHTSLVLLKNKTCITQNWQNSFIKCQTQSVNSITSGYIKLCVQRFKLRPNEEVLSSSVFLNPFKIKIIESSKSSETYFNYLLPELISIQPTRVISYKKVKVTLKGQNLNIGSIRKIFLNFLECKEIESNKMHEINCISSEFKNLSSPRKGPVVLHIDNAQLTLKNASFCYSRIYHPKPNPKASEFLQKVIHNLDYYLNYSENGIDYIYNVEIYSEKNVDYAILSRTTVSHFDYQVHLLLSCENQNIHLIHATGLSISTIDYDLALSNQIHFENLAFFVSFVNYSLNLSFVCFYPITEINQKLNLMVRNCYGEFPHFDIADRLSSIIDQNLYNCDLGCQQDASSLVISNLFSQVPVSGFFFFEFSKIFTSIFTFSSLITNNTLIIIGTQDGYIMKLIYRKLLSVKKHSKNSILSFSYSNQNSKTLFYRTSLNTSELSYNFETCSIYTTCFQCLSVLDPLSCKWCDKSCQNTCNSPAKTCNLTIASFKPIYGPLKGGTEIHINVSNLAVPDDPTWFVLVKIINETCPLTKWIDGLIACKTNAVIASKSGFIEIIVKVNHQTSNNKTLNIFPSPIILKSASKFHFVQPILTSIEPYLIPTFKTQKIKLFGKYLNIGSRRMIKFASLSCPEQHVYHLHMLVCTLTPAFLVHKPEVDQVSVFIDDDKLYINATFTYTGILNDKELQKDHCLINETTYITQLVQKMTTVFLDKSITFLGRQIFSEKIYIINAQTTCKENLTIKTNSFSCEAHPPSVVNCSLPILPKECFPLIEPVQSKLTLTDLCSTVNSSTFNLMYYPDPKIYNFDLNNNSLIIEKEVIKIKIKGQWLNKNLDIQAYLVDEIKGKWLSCIEFEQIDNETIRCLIHHNGHLNLEDKWQVRAKIGKKDYQLGLVKMIPGPKWINIKMDHILKTGAIFFMIITFIPILCRAMKNIKNHLNLDYSFNSSLDATKKTSYEEDA